MLIIKMIKKKKKKIQTFIFNNSQIKYFKMNKTIKIYKFKIHDYNILFIL